MANSRLNGVKIIMGKKYQLKSFLPIYEQVMRAVLEKGRVSMTYESAFQQQSERFRFYKFKSAYIEQGEDQELVEMLHLIRFTWHKEGATIEIYDPRKEDRNLKVMEEALKVEGVIRRVDNLGDLESMDEPEWVFLWV